MKIIVILSKGYFCRKPLNPVEVWQVLEPDKLVMQIALAKGWGETATYYSGDKKKKIRQCPSVCSAEFMCTPCLIYLN